MAYNPTKQHAYSLPANKTRSYWKDQTHKGEGFNEIRFESENGREEVFMHAQKDHNTVIENDETHQIVHDRSKSVGNDQSESVGHDKSISVGNDHSESAGNNATISVGVNRSTSIGQDQRLNVGRDHFTDIGHIQPGKPQQNAYIERFNRTVRQEWLGTNIFYSIEEVQNHATKWLWTYNNDRPNMAIGGITPKMKLNQHQTQLKAA